MKRKSGTRFLSVLLTLGLTAGLVFPVSVYAAQESDQPSESYEEELLLAYGLSGMPEDFELSGEEYALKADSAAHTIADSLSELEEGVDYAANEVFFLAEDETYARQVAAAYNAELTSFEYGVAVLSLDPEKTSVEQAVKAGEDLRLPLPHVSPNYITYLDDPTGEEVVSDGSGLDQLGAGELVPESDREYWSQFYGDPALEPDYIYDGKSAYQWMHDAVGTYKAWGTTTGDPDILVAVIDSGVYSDHEELAGRVSTIDVLVNEDPIDYSGHGTHVAGIIAADGGNGVGGVGIAPDVSILSLPVFIYDEDEGVSYCTQSDEARAINAAVSAGADIINMSLGGPQYSPYVQMAVLDAYYEGVTIVAAMGNENSNNLAYPAGYDHVIAVGALNQGNIRTDFSTWGSWADISAPGSQIFSTWNGHADAIEKNNENCESLYASWDGTSMAAPVVAGACALYMSANGHVSPDVMESVLKKTAAKVKGSGMGAGLVNVGAMLPGGDDTAPIVDTDGDPLTKLSPNSSLHFYNGTDQEDSDYSEGFGYVYTLDGKNPAVKDGAVTQGYLSGDGNVAVYNLLAEHIIVTGQSYILKVAKLSPQGKLGKVYQTTIRVESDDSEELSIEGPDYIASGKTAVYKALYQSSRFTNAGTTWSIDPDTAIPGVSIQEKTGKLTVEKTARVPSEITILAVSEIDEDVYEEKEILLVAPASAVEINAYGEDDLDPEINIPGYGKKGELQTVRIYSSDLGSEENSVLLVGRVTGNDSYPVFTSANPGIASVEETEIYDGAAVVRITGHKAGKTKITCQAQDGSGKKTFITVQVIVPVSDITVYAKGDQQQAVAAGKSIQLYAALGTAYGKPTFSKVDWSINEVEGHNTSIGDSAAKQYLTLKNGKLTVNKNIPLYSDSWYEVTVSASAADGTDVSGSKTLIVTAPTTAQNSFVVYPDYKQKAGALPAGISESLIVQSDFCQAYQQESFEDPDLRRIGPVIKSSNPQVVSATYSGPALSDDEEGIEYWFSVTTYKRGSATLTISYPDGSGKKTTFKVIVY
ncbi:MAG: S8 family serine peptidase [Lachnospiraceae bacterium]|nr:S8 family serine peptidase [Lachnospiraceae bacterium]